MVLAEYGETGVGVMGICKRLKIPLVVHFHGYDAYQNQVLDRHRETYKKMFAFSSAIIVVSKHMYDQLVKLGAPREKVFYNPCGIDLTKFKQACLASSPLHVLAVGRFVEKKAPYLTILAFKKVLDALPKAKLIMAGEGELYDVCHQIAKSLRIEHAVELRGAVTHEEVASLMQQSRIFVQHSLVPGSGDSEGTPVGILEAGASGLPIVSTKHAGIIDAVRDGETGFLVNEGDIDAMSDYMHRLLSNPELAVEMGRRGREHMRNNFNITTSIKNLRDILDKCSL